jgi:hypothetical protein
MRARVQLASLIAGLMLVPTATVAHPGGLNAEGCHNDRKNGGYHCHRGSGETRRQPQSATTPRAMVGGGLGYGTARAFRNCDEARAAGAAPVRRGEPGYGPHLDRDNDGVGCEPIPRNRRY